MEARAAKGLRIHSIRKAFGTHEVLKGIDLNLEPGYVHALLGPNGAGKSSLLSCLSGAIEPDSGSIIVDGRQYHSLTPTEAFGAGISIIYQHFQLVDSLSCSDNIFLGRELRTRFGAIDFAEQNRQTRALFNSLGVAINPATIVGSLNIGEQQIVEIARALSRRPSVLILDEPTAALSEKEVEALLALVRRLADEHGLTIVYVTHLLDEVMQVADTVTVIRDGAVLWQRARTSIELDDIIFAISPDAIEATRRTRTLDDRVLLGVEDLRTNWSGPISFDARDGEIIGVFGILGSGRTDLLEALAGARPRTGQVLLDGGSVEATGPGSARESGIALVASDRKQQSLFGELSAMENLLMPHYGQTARPIRLKARELSIFERISRSIGLQPNDPHRDADKFSGGNAQKLVIGRWISGLDATRLLLLDEPTQGVDIGARRDLYALLRSFVDVPGRAIVFASSDPEELIALADRVLILSAGKIVASVNPRVGEQALIALAHGHSFHAAANQDNSHDPN
ncbi:sugar ABC transporter ATP-binding protein [Phyllobacterium endophyticum]|uniref:Autoinducer 2 import ATP-binding protein LsrA n=1 Tax=Phyllobacterium endophyticum TaxID=1149773 RepID=A0A2P7ARZ3_9HYPH|nr:sugar ABC transporter ATP-binding protein [Phyllobacterium endophyticum]MBB3236702.1 ribose transport system ATP-binding protein [Phyllobacterium endophyticum]PSH56995.1 sugar ABC transporter ATP-binding protein [Phyllobacterium endophyticum]TYR39683.1 sugar ABC transporter ATP-binding protein [Phyllobacterium endophyticum]